MRVYINVGVCIYILKERENVKFQITTFKLRKNSIFFFLNLQKFTFVLQK